MRGPGLIVIISPHRCEKKPSASVLFAVILQPVKYAEAGPPPRIPSRVITEDSGGVGGLFADNKMSPVAAADMFSCRATGRGRH